MSHRYSRGTKIQIWYPIIILGAVNDFSAVLLFSVLLASTPTISLQPILVLVTVLVFVFTHPVVSPNIFTRGCNSIFYVGSGSFWLSGTSPNFIAAQVELCTHSLPDLSACLCRWSFHPGDPVV